MKDFGIAIPKLNYRKIFWIVALFIGILMPVLSFDYGVIEDDGLHDAHGKVLLNYFMGKDSLASQGLFNEKGELPKIIDISDERNHMRQMNIDYGGFFDLITAFLHQYFNFIGEFEFRNLINSLFGFLLFLFTGFLAKELGGWKTAVFAFLFIVLTPVLFGHSMYNPKDIPFAAFYMFSLFHIVKLVKELPKIKFKRAIFLIINISLLINIRVLGLVMLAFFFFAIFAWWVIKNSENKFKNIDIKKTIILALKITSIGFVAYLAACIFWPYDQNNPLKIPLFLFLNINKVAFFNGFHFFQLFEGKWISNTEIPWYFIPKWLLILTMPLHIILGIFLIILLYFKKIISPVFSSNLFLISFVLFASLFPIFYAVISGSHAFDNCRHFLFTLPPLISVCGLSWKYLFDIIQKKTIKFAFYLILALLLLQPFQWMIINHPLESLYFSPLIGGPNGAFCNYEMDYWGVAVKPAVKWIEKNATNATPEKPVRVRLFYGEQLKASYYVDKIPYLKFVQASYISPDWDYSIFMSSEAKHDHDLLLKNWPPKNTVFRVKVDTVTVCAVVKNTLRSNSFYTDSIEAAISAHPTVEGYIQLSLLYYNNSNYIKCVDASRKVLMLNPSSVIAYNNMCAAYNSLLMFDEAKIAGEKALQLVSNYELTKNNLKVTEKGIIQRKERKLLPSQYLNLSYNYYIMGNYQACIKVCKELLEIDPSNAVAYNNICSCYNALGNYKEAEKACQQALKFKPDFDLAKNNLKIAEKTNSGK
ncbi:MAG: tetratricopeptide repeat protein [Bacteroidales bacterium]|jgi:tetratricopeptide (TPR) repeat protein